MSTNKPNYLNLTDAQKDYIRANAGKISTEKIVYNLYTSRHEVVTFLIEEKLPLGVKKGAGKREKKPKEKLDNWMKQIF